MISWVLVRLCLRDGLFICNQSFLGDRRAEPEGQRLKGRDRRAETNRSGHSNVSKQEFDHIIGTTPWT